MDAYDSFLQSDDCLEAALEWATDLPDSESPEWTCTLLNGQRATPDVVKGIAQNVALSMSTDTLGWRQLLVCFTQSQWAMAAAWEQWLVDEMEQRKLEAAEAGEWA